MITPQSSSRELEQLATALRDTALLFEPRQEVRHLYAPLLEAEILADGVYLVIPVLQNLPCYAEASNVFGSCFTGERFT